MSGIGDLTADLECDISQFVAPMETAADVTEESGERIIKVIHEQETSWKTMIAHVVPELAHFGSAVAHLAGHVLIAHHIGEAWHVVTSAVNASGVSVLTYGRYGLSLASQFIPPLKGIALAVTSVTVAYKVGTSEMVTSAIKNDAATKQVIASYGTLSTATSQLGGALSQASSDGFEVVNTALENGLALILKYDPSINILRTGAQVVATGMDLAADGITATAEATSTLSDYYSKLAYVASELGQTTAAQEAAWDAETASLRSLASETERVIALQEAQKASFQTLGSIQVTAIANAEHSAEVARLGSLKTIEAIDNETRALQAKATAAALAGKPMDPKQLGDLFGALANQKQGVLSGRIKPDEAKQSPVDKMIADAQQQLTKLQTSELDVAIAAARAAGGTDEQVNSLRNLLGGIDAAKDANEALKLSEAARADELKRQYALEQQGIDRIESMRDKIDLLTGAATEGEIAMRELSRQGFTDEQIAEIGALTDEVKRLEDAKSNKKGKSIDTSNKAALAGSSEANSIILRGVLQPAGASSAEKLQKQQLAEQKATTIAVKANKPQQLQVAKF